jgi:hypothetical protein
MSELPFDGHRDDRNEAGCRQLLEMHKVRRGVERNTVASRSIRPASMAVRRTRVVCRFGRDKRGTSLSRKAAIINIIVIVIVIAHLRI